MKIICLKGGLGNQMFEYCRYKMLKDKGEKVFIYYDKRRLKQHKNILISDVFNIDMPKDYLWVKMVVWYIKLLRTFHIAPSLYDDEKYENSVILIVYQFLLLSLHKITTSGCGIRPTTH